jgi:hypothetical protein
MKLFAKLVAMLALGVSVAACDSPDQSQSALGPRVNTPFTPEISINEIMVAQIDHAAHFIWDATSPDSVMAEIDWQEVEHHAIQLISSRAAMTMGGTGVNDQMWIAQPSWRDYVNRMNDASLLALASARQRNREQLTRASNMLIDTCETCHRQYKPTIPTEGYTKQH